MQIHAVHDSREPTTLKQALKSPDSEKWVKAMNEELASIAKNKTWTAVDLPHDRTPIGSKWVFKIKQDTGNNTIYKARLVAQGYTQKFGTDYDEITAPVVRSATFRTLLAVSSHRNWPIYQFDVKTAFLNGHLDEEIYLKPPPGTNVGSKVMRLHKSLYGLKQAAYSWNKTLNLAMSEAGFTQSKHDECLFIYLKDSEFCYAICHVDDLLFACSSEELSNQIAQKLSKFFELKSLGQVENVDLGIL
jgi:Reverse transcriptase (RNA-dependent DNA polymerase)